MTATRSASVSLISRPAPDASISRRAAAHSRDGIASSSSRRSALALSKLCLASLNWPQASGLP